MKHTDIDKLKEIALDFLDIDPEAVPEFPLIVNHPYYDNRIMALPKPTEDGQFNVEPFDIFECPEKFEKLKSHMRESIINRITISALCIICTKLNVFLHKTLDF